ncbi:MAG: hypothetical protein WCD23_08350, partial [Candidatus Acidiferrales bacterium]
DAIEARSQLRHGPTGTRQLLHIYSIRERRASNKRGAECEFCERRVRRTGAKTGGGVSFRAS